MMISKALAEGVGALILARVAQALGCQASTLYRLPPSDRRTNRDHEQNAKDYDESVC